MAPATVMEERDPSRPIVHIYVRKPGFPGHCVGKLYEDQIRAHSTMVARQIDNGIEAGAFRGDELDKNVFLDDISPGPARLIVREVDNLYRRKKAQPSVQLELKINAYDLPIDQGVALWTVVLAMGICSPTQDHIERQLSYYVARNKLSPADMLVVAQGSYQYRRTHKLWDVLTQQIAHDVLHKKYTKSEGNALQEAAQGADAMPELWKELFERYCRMSDNKERREQRAARRAARNQR